MERIYNALPPESRTGRVQLLLPANLQAFDPTALSSAPPPPPPPLLPPAPGPPGLHGGGGGEVDAWGAGGVRGVPQGPACALHLAATGDQTFGRRLRLGFPLLKDVSATHVWLWSFGDFPGNLQLDSPLYAQMSRHGLLNSDNEPAAAPLTSNSSYERTTPQLSAFCPCRQCCPPVPHSFTLMSFPSMALTAWNTYSLFWKRSHIHVHM